MEHVLGVDGGNSKTFALTADVEGRVLGFARAEGSNHERIGFTEAKLVLERVARESLAQAGMDAPVDLVRGAGDCERRVGNRRPADHG